MVPKGHSFAHTSMSPEHSSILLEEIAILYDFLHNTVPNSDDRVVPYSGTPLNHNINPNLELEAQNLINNLLHIIQPPPVQPFPLPVYDHSPNLNSTYSNNSSINTPPYDSFDHIMDNGQNNSFIYPLMGFIHDQYIMNYQNLSYSDFGMFPPLMESIQQQRQTQVHQQYPSPPLQPRDAKRPRRRNRASKNDLECGICHRMFSRPYNLRSHQRTHTNERPYECLHPNCGWSFARQHDLKRHELLHSGVKPHVCGCGKQFSRRDAFNRHQKTDPRCIAFVPNLM